LRAEPPLRTLRDASGEYTPGTAVHPGDTFGSVIAWLWHTSPDEVALVLTDYISQIHKWDDLAADQSPPVRLDDILDGLAFAVPKRLLDCRP
jgi:hypothetical protein